MNQTQFPTANNWLEAIARRDRAIVRAFQGYYGSDEDNLRARADLIRKVLRRFLERFGNQPVRLFRSPGRINLRGMHVDTHGGYLNLMTHQREVVLALTAAQDGGVTMCNIEPEFGEVSFKLSDFTRCPAFQLSWPEFTGAPEIHEHIVANRGAWGSYLKGAALMAQFQIPDTAVPGFYGVVGSDLPRGAALSSSSALTTAALLGVLSLNGVSLPVETLIGAVEYAEWFSGMRGGISDQTAMLLGAPDEMLNTALKPGDVDLSGLQRVRFPSDLRVLVINSYTTRSLSGAQMIEFTRNRFAYSLALEIARQELAAAGAPPHIVNAIDRLPRLAPLPLGMFGGERLIYQVLRHIPVEMEVAALREAYHLAGFDEAYDRYFGTAPPEQRPASVCLRGPLLFGIAESERARLFPQYIQARLHGEAGRLMSIGHDGDRRVTADGGPYVQDISGAALERLEREGAAIHLCPGVYQASSPALDALVDAAMAGGALGASLTGGGIAGTVLALCDEQSVSRVAEEVCACLLSAEYQARAGRVRPLSEDEARAGVVVNQATAGAGELVFPGNPGGRG